MMKKLLCTILLIFCSTFLAGCGKNSLNSEDMLSRIKFRNKIIIGIKEDSKPFGFSKDGQITGFDADVAKEIVRKLLGDDKSEKYEFIPVTPESRIHDLNSRKVDILIATMSINPNRSSVVSFSAPYFIAGQAIMVPLNSNILSMEDLNNKKVVVILGTTGEKTIRQLAPNATVLGKRTYTEAFSLLKQGSVNAMLADDSILYGFLMDNKGYKILPQRYTKEYYAVAIRQGKENESLKTAIDNIITEMQKSGKLNRIKEKWIPALFSIK